MKRLNIEEYDLLFELVKHYILTTYDYRRKEELRLEIAKVLNCDSKDAIKLVDSFYPEIHQQITAPIKRDLEKDYKHLYFSEVH